MLLGRENQLLAALPAALYERWGKALVLRELKEGQALNLNRKSGEVYFPISCVIAVHTASTWGQTVFMRFVGSSFAAGLVSMVATNEVIFDGIVCGSGYAMTIQSDIVMRSIDSPALSGTAQSIAMARTAKGGLMIAQCSVSHASKQRLARLLLQAHDCFGAERPITLSQQLLGQMLVTRRETVAASLSEWSEAGFIELRRKAILIHDLNKLKSESCECYTWIQQSYIDEFSLWKSIRWYGV